MLQVHLFGASTVVGESLLRQIQVACLDLNVFSYSRRSLDGFDLTHPAQFIPLGDPVTPSIWISFAPIWLFAKFFDCLASESPQYLSSLKGLVACSSSSAITKRFAFNSFDHALASRLNASEDQLIEVCNRLAVPCRILQPTLVYGQVGNFKDRNLNVILRFLRQLPVLPLPSQTGLRQPIHASQVAAVSLFLSFQILHSSLPSSLPTRIPIGGDINLTYAEMIKALQLSLPPGDPARRCRLILIPNRIFFFFAALLLLRSPKSYEAVLRMSANLSGFIAAHQLLGCEPQSFPVEAYS